MALNDETKGVEGSEGFQPVGAPSEDIGTNMGNGTGGDHYGFRYFSQVFNSLEERLPFTTALVTIIGYIIIAAFGNMATYNDFLRYTLFLLFVFVLYKFVKTEIGSFFIKRQTIIATLIALLLLGFIAIDHKEDISSLTKRFTTYVSTNVASEEVANGEALELSEAKE